MGKLLTKLKTFQNLPRNTSQTSEQMVQIDKQLAAVSEGQTDSSVSDL